MNRKLLLLALLLCSASGAFASTLIQGNWRWRNDNGDETTATFKAAQNVPIVISDNNPIRLRIRVENESNAGDATHAVGGLKYSTSASGPFTDINSNATTAAFVYAQSSVAPDSKAPTTNSTYLTTINAAALNPFTYLNGEYFDGDRDLTSNPDKSSISPSRFSDLEFVIKPTANIATNTTYYFIIENAKDNGSHNLARLTTAATILPVNFLNFDVRAVSNRVQLKWSTASEKNNARFEVSRSTDSKTWQVVGSQLGKGNSDVTSNYSIDDLNPLNGVSYYELAQFDHDGTKTVLSTKAVNLSLDAAVDVQVFPNPTSKEINLSVANYNGKSIVASLFSQDGKLVHKEQFDNNVQGKKLNISKMPSAGVYVLKVTGEGLAASKKVVIL